jgi:hypothetical protein
MAIDLRTMTLILCVLVCDCIRNLNRRIEALSVHG